MLIDSYNIELYCPPCEPGTEVWAATATTATDLSELIPYVNAVVEKGDYTPGVPALVWKDGAHKLFLKAHEVGVNNLNDRADADHEVARLVKFLNETWDERANITPDFTTRTKPNVLEVLKLLPRTNCGQCGVPSCMAFAVALAKGDRSFPGCPPLMLEAESHNREKLAELGL
ncbi:MAG: (Fe-S)-binding protein [Thermoleophilia bacterium]